MDHNVRGQVLISCDICGRNFNSEALSRHRPICLKATQKKRKVFDSSKQRAEGTDLIQYQRNNGAAAARKNREPGPKKSSWQQKHSDFINTIRAARGLKMAMERGEPLPPPPPPTYDPDYIQCDYCGRRFNENAAQRHITFCKQQQERLQNKKKPDTSASQKQAARFQYQPPTLKKAAPGSQPSDSDCNEAGGFSVGNKSSALSSKITNSSPARPRCGVAFQPANRTCKNMTENPRPDRPPSGQALKTGRTVQTHPESRPLGANQRAGLASRKHPSSDNIRGSSFNSSQYTGTGFASSSGGSSSGVGMASKTSTGSTLVNAKGRGSSTTVKLTPSAGRFCYECGKKFASSQAKFCCECGTKNAVNA